MKPGNPVNKIAEDIYSKQAERLLSLEKDLPQNLFKTIYLKIEKGNKFLMKIYNKTNPAEDAESDCAYTREECLNKTYFVKKTLKIQKL